VRDLDPVTALDAIGDKIERGERLGRPDADALLASTDLTAIGMLAESARRRRHGNRITFVRVAPVALAESGTWDGPFPASAGELRITGAPDNLDTAIACTRRVAAAAAGTPVSGFLLTDLDAWCERSGIALGDVLGRLRDAGLQLVAEAPLDGLRDAERALGTLAGSGLSLGRLTVTRLRSGDRLDTIDRARRLQEELNIVRCFAPLPRTSSVLQPSTGYDDVKQVALARLLIDNIRSIQVDWQLHGAKLSQVALMFGADDIDAVPASDMDGVGLRRTPLEEVRRNIRAASLEPAERDGLFEAVGR
jgi:aminodeoxyfutalosine synthase